MLDHYNITLQQFSYRTLEGQLRSALSQIARHGIRELESKDLRSNTLNALNGDERLSNQEVMTLCSIAVDELEESKFARKISIRRLATHGYRNNDFLLDICASAEQGIQRLAFQLLHHFAETPVTDDFLRDVARIAANVDDIGVGRRLILSAAELKLTSLDAVVTSLGTSDEGVRRRAFEAIERNKVLVQKEWGSTQLREFLEKCDAKLPSKSDWNSKLKAMLKELN